MTFPYSAMRATLALSMFVFTFFACNKETPAPSFTLGKNNFTITIDGVQRQYVVHVPKGYDGKNRVPMVIMCHGGGQSGEQFYNISGWKEVGDSLNILTVFPSALSYCVVEDGQTSNITKWNSLPGGAEFCAGQDIKDDLKFMRSMFTELEKVYLIDEQRIYMVGFSSGGQFTATCAICMSDQLAAAISCGGGGSIPPDTMLTPVRKLPVMLMFGNRDGKILANVGLPSTAALPMGFDQLYSQYPILYARQPKPYINTFQLDENNFTTGGDTSSVVYADYKGLSGDPDNVFRMVEVKGLEHEYPNGINYPLHGASWHWNWLKNFSL